MDLRGKTYWLIGASEGLGRALAQALDAQGARLILSARSIDRLQEMVDTLQDARAVPFDVTDRQSVAQAADQARHIDGVIYCAGAYDPITAQTWDPVSVERMCDVNYMGAVRVLGHVVPDMAGRDSGHIVLIGSLSGHRGLPGAIGYGSSKAALMHLGENLLADLRKTNVKVQVVNPGFIRTRLTGKNDFDMPQIMPPEAAADHVIRAMQSRRFETNFPRPFSWLFLVGRLMPRRWFLRLF